MNEIQVTRDEMLIKLDTAERTTQEQFLLVKDTADRDKTSITQMVERVREDVNNQLKKELGEVKYLVTHMTSQATEHRETLQADYNKKLEDTKDVVSKFFNKYERFLVNQQKLIKDMETRQDEWIKKLIEPQTNNEARLFSIDTRINEGEATRLDD